MKRKINGKLLEAILDSCNDEEYKVEHSAEIKDLLTNQEQIRLKIVESSNDPEMVIKLLEELDYLYHEKFNVELISDIEMILSGSFFFEN